jgi:CHAT domain-containing protein
VYDLERLTCPPRLVVLSACHGGDSAVRAGDELIGLSSALLALGTRTVVAAVAPVHDLAIVSFVHTFHEHVRAGVPAATAVARARTGLEHGAFTVWGA